MSRFLPPTFVAALLVGLFVGLFVAGCDEPSPTEDRVTGTSTPRAPATSTRSSTTQSRTTSTTSTPSGSVAPRTTAPPATPASLPEGDDTTIERVVDGDTIVTGLGKVRLIGIDTPETVDPRRPVGCFGHEASANTSKLLPPGTRVRLVYDVEPRDRYERLLAYVYRRDDRMFVNARIVRDGFASILTIPPNVAHADDFLRLQREAREAGRGLWNACAGALPFTEAPPSTTAPGASGACDPAYPDSCIPSSPPDLDCGDVSARRFRVLPPDPHRFDGNGDGIGCEG